MSMSDNQKKGLKIALIAVILFAIGFFYMKSQNPPAVEAKADGVLAAASPVASPTTEVKVEAVKVKAPAKVEKKSEKKK